MSDVDAILLRLATLAYIAAFNKSSDTHSIARALGDAGLRRLLQACEHCVPEEDHDYILMPLGAALPELAAALRALTEKDLT